MEYRHIPVMLQEAIDSLQVKAGKAYIDCTLGGGSYSQEILKQGGEVLAIDADPLAIDNAKKKIGSKKITLVNDNFRNLKTIISQNWPRKKIAGIVMDLGISSAQLDDESRGFSFQKDTPLDMAFSGGSKTQEIVNNYSESELARIIQDYGEESWAKAIAKAIAIQRRRSPITSTQELVDIINKVIPGRGKIHPATKTFQALRMATNEELESIREVLPQALELLEPGGYLAIVSFHSLEDRIVKNFFRQESKNCICSPEIPICNCQHRAQLELITKKPLVPSSAEIKANPRSRSAKLRVIRKK